MIEPLNSEHLRAFQPNEYSNPTGLLPVLNSRSWHKFALIDKGSTQAILCMREYHPRHYESFVLVSKNYRLRNSQEMRDFVHSLRDSHGAIRIQTESEDSAALNHWHEYLGFVYEGTKKKMIDGKDFCCWGLVFGE
jgi:hypothetical protein